MGHTVIGGQCARKVKEKSDGRDPFGQAKPKQRQIDIRVKSHMKFSSDKYEVYSPVFLVIQILVQGIV